MCGTVSYMNRATWFYRSSVKRYLSLETHRMNLKRIVFNKILYSLHYGPGSVSLTLPLPEGYTRAGAPSSLSLHRYLRKAESPLDQKEFEEHKKRQRSKIFNNTIFVHFQGLQLLRFLFSYFLVVKCLFWEKAVINDQRTIYFLLSLCGVISRKQPPLKIFYLVLFYIPMKS